LHDKPHMKCRNKRLNGIKIFLVYLYSMENSKITKWFLLVGKIEGYSYLILLLIAMPLKYLYNTPEYVRPVGSIHGALFVTFMILLAMMFFKVKMSFKNAVLSFLLSLVPFGTFFLKRLV